MFIPTTPRGALKKKLQDMDQAVGFKNKCRYVETVGQSILSILFNKDPWKLPCGRPNCLLCLSEPGSCTTKGVVYNMECLICKEEHQPALYIGETARTPYERCLEHLDLIRLQSEESPFIEHQNEKHPGEEVKVSMKVVSKEPRPLDRLTLEGTMISEHRSGLLLNRKGEWGQNLPPQFGILDSEDKAASRLRPEKGQKKKRVREEEEEEVVKTPCKKSKKLGSKKDQPPPGPGPAVKSSAEDLSQIIIEKPQTPSVRSFLIKACTSTHELGLREGFQGKKSMSKTQSGANGLNSKVGGSLKGKGKVRPASVNEVCDKRQGFHPEDQMISRSTLHQIAAKL